MLAARTMLLSLMLLDIFMLSLQTGADPPPDTDITLIMKRTGDSHHGTGQTENKDRELSLILSSLRYWVCGEGQLLPMSLLQM